MKNFWKVVTRKTAEGILNLIARFMDLEPIEVLARFIDDQEEFNRLVRLLVGSQYPIIEKS